MDGWLICVYVAVGYIIAVVFHGILTRKHPSKRFGKVRDRALELLHMHVNLQAEVADCEQELVELWQTAPDAQSRFIVESVERSRLIHPTILALAKKFGFSVPEDIQAAQAEEAATRNSTPPPPPNVMQSVVIDAWGQPLEIEVVPTQAQLPVGQSQNGTGTV